MRRCLFCIALLLMLTGCASAANSTPITVTPQPTQSTAQANLQGTAQALVNGTPQEGASTPTQTSEYKPGESVQSWPWSIIVNGLRETSNSGNEFETPKQGDTYLLITVTAKNADTNTHRIDSFEFVLRDISGNTYQQTCIAIADCTSFGSVVSSQQVKGDVAYEVPTSLHSFTLQFDSPSDYTNSELVQWTLNV